MKNILFLPLDERPCNYNFPKILFSNLNDYVLNIIPRDYLGDCKKPGDYTKISSFILDNVSKNDICVMSLDTLLYGGLVPSRLHHLSINELKNRLEVIKKIKVINPNIKLYVFASIMRCPSYNTNEEEPDYYNEVGEDIFNYGILKNKLVLNLIDEEEFNLESKKYLNKISYCYEDYEKRRETNLSMLLSFIELAKKYVDFLIIPQDDSAPFGYTRMDREKVSGKIKELKMDVNVYAGSDEVGMVALARAVKDDLKIDNIGIEVIYPKPECSNLIPMYEDKPIQYTLEAQLNTIGFKIVKHSKLKLYMNYPTKDMVNMGSKPSIGYEERDLPNFVNKIVNDINSGNDVLLCDGAYGNGGEELILKLIQKQTSLFNLASYAGWNTSSNSLGTVLAQGMLISLFGKREVDNEFIALRTYEDVGYCGSVRWYVWHEEVDKYGCSYYDIKEKDGIIAKIIHKNMDEYVKLNFPEVYKKYKIEYCVSPWHRIFEIEISLTNKN